MVACSGLKMFHKKLNKATWEYSSSTAVLISLGCVVYEKKNNKKIAKEKTFTSGKSTKLNNLHFVEELLLRVQLDTLSEWAQLRQSESYFRRLAAHYTFIKGWNVYNAVVLKICGCLWTLKSRLDN